MFRSATFKLTAWYISILVIISLLFSVVIYSISATEVRSRLDYDKIPQGMFGSNYQNLGSFRDMQVQEAESNLITSLAIANISIWVIGGIGSYYLARRTLMPIEEAHEAQSRFTSDASHELRTPLASMKTELEVALRDPNLSEADARELLVSNLEEVDKLTKLSQTLLQLSQLDHDKIKLEDISLNTALKSAIERFNKAEARVTFADEPSKNILANRSSIEELMTILIDNAVKYSPDSTKVKVRIVTRKNLTGFEVSNEGKGISEEDLPHIFDRFYRADTSRTGGKKKGYGLGLSLAKKIVELHGGELAVTSGVNQITTFRVLLQNPSKNQAKNQ
jgi:signal transduction histidine kinase